MKTITTILSTVILLISQMVIAQSKADKMYDTFANKDGITGFTFSKNMIDAIDINIDGDGEEKRVTGDLHQVRFMSYNPENGKLGGFEFIDKAIGCLPGSVYHKVQDSGSDNDAEIWVSGNKKKFSECHVFVKNKLDKEMKFVVSFYGDFTVNDLDGLKKAGKGFSKK